MKIGIVSDLHLDYYPEGSIESLENRINDTQMDLLVIAGDISNGYRDARFGLEIHHPHIMIFGNHDYYGCQLRSDTYEDDLFVGGTLWTNWRDNPLYMLQYGPLADFKRIFKEDWSLILPKDLVPIFREHKKLILDSHREFVVTHFPPSAQSVTAEYKDDIYTPFFCNNFSVEGKKLWIHGHVHSEHDYIQEGCRVICHPLGYPGELYKNIEDYVPKVIEI